MMNEENVEKLKYLLEYLEDMELIALHSYLRNDHRGDMVRVDELITTDGLFDIGFDLTSAQFMTYIEMELNQRNLN